MAGPVISNFSVYFAIARDALARSQELDAAQQRPIGEGHSGNVITWDPSQSSFKQSLIAIIFAGVYLDALIFIATNNLRASAKKLPKAKKGLERYENAMLKLGISDPETLAAVRRLNNARDQIAHERAVELITGTITEHLYFAQREAEQSVRTVQRVSERLGISP